MTDIEQQEAIAQVLASRIATRSTFAAILFALGEAKAVDVNEALAYIDVLVQAYRQPVGVTEATSLRVLGLVADEMAELRPAMVKMAIMPQGAGRA